ncbi:DUF1553 domain-containing protein [Roseiconus nitratireducens]|uniref:DUF1553 domain-containing protein n=1 Tax=Roseiconus nitratireducens TaxID=2605748 RepID=A0A5M6DI20_9BACT|nr:DUF1553 domain-containing protein [Roseiconus nitratireducens]KAA5547194.1 DUF1553 domain-containing protein [Roseiconus nitratireducens]
MFDSLPGRLGVRILLVLTAGLIYGNRARGYEPDSVEFFEQRIRPVLVQRCYSCHSAEADEIGGSLWLDSAGAMRSGGDSGPAIRPGDADASVLVSAIRYESSEMPPDEPLGAEVVEDFVRWINAGAIDPRAGAPRSVPKDETIDLERGRQFWAFQPLSGRILSHPQPAAPSSSGYEPSLTEPDGDSSVARQIDVHLVDALQARGAEPNPVAEPETRLRRLAFDLTGLPPEESLRQRWLQDPTPDAWRRIVDELLNSRAFAQHWGRHWMDVARYADSNGSDFNATFHDAWRYRDYLVDSFDQDRPLDQMIRQQVAGDLLPSESEQQRYDNVVASTFLMLGPKMLSERDKVKLTMDVVDEQIDTIGRAFLGMTLGCARCHDHKFDPIATEDYYALAGIFKSTQTLRGESQKYVSTWNRVELPTSEEHRRAIRDHQKQVRSVKEQIEQAEKDVLDAERSVEQGIVVDDADATRTGQWVQSTYTKGFVGVGYVHDNNTDKGKASIEFRAALPEDGRYVVRIAYSAGGNRAGKVPATLTTADGPQALVINQQQPTENGPWFTLGTFPFLASQDAVLVLRNDGTEGYVIADAVQFLAVDPAAVDQKRQSAQAELADARGKLETLRERLKQLEQDQPRPVPVAMAPRDLPSTEIADSPVHIRGEVRNLGDPVPRGFVRVCGPGEATIGSPSGSGRLELAQWLTDPDHPLVSRVLVNRIWGWVFGEGIVRTVDNFGSRGERPTHPELLDSLALDFMRNGWRLKPLVRKLVLTDAYARSSTYSVEAAAIDPENRLLWRAHRKRLTAESIRDAMLSAADVLTQQQPIEPVADKGVLVSKNRADSTNGESGIERPVRTIYLPVIRGNIDPMLTALDAADPDLLVGKRPTTNVPAQALVLINSDQVNAWAAETAAAVLARHPSRQQGREAEWIVDVYRTCLSREPSAKELRLGHRWLGDADGQSGSEPLQRLTDLVAAIFASSEFRMTD